MEETSFPQSCDLESTLLRSIPELGEVLKIGKVIGEGTFSTVYEARLKSEFQTPNAPDKYAVKHLTPIIEPSIQANELNFLTMLNGQHNVVKNVFAARHRDNVALVMPYHKHDKFSRLIKRFSVADVQHYMRNLLVALRYIHSRGMIHRDVKPNNFLYCLKSQSCALVDFGLAQFENADNETASPLTTTQLSADVAMTPLKDSTNQKLSNGSCINHEGTRKRKSPCDCRGRNQVCRRCLAAPGISAARAGTAGYRPPEVLLKCAKQTTAVDMWACGVILLSLLSGRPNFFNAPDDMTSLCQLVALFGKGALCEAAERMGKRLLVEIDGSKPSTLKRLCQDLHNNSRLKALRCRRKAPVVFPDSAYDLLEKMLALHPEDRITAEAALHHPFLALSS